MGMRQAGDGDAERFLRLGVKGERKQRNQEKGGVESLSQGNDRSLILGGKIFTIIAPSFRPFGRERGFGV